jgi:hypothetical protein
LIFDGKKRMNRKCTRGTIELEGRSIWLDAMGFAQCCS